MTKKTFQRFFKRKGLRLRSRWIYLVRDPDNLPTIALCAAAIISSLVSVLYSKLFRWSEHAFIYLANYFGWWMILGSSGLFFLGSYLVFKIVPEAGGSGIPQVMASIKVEYTTGTHSRVDRLLSMKTAVVKVLSSILIILGGGAIGREGPTLHVSSCIFHFFAIQFRKLSIQISEQTWVIAGTAAGLAAAFNTPLGGIVYAVEELGIVHFHKIRTALIAAVILSGVFAQWLVGPYLYLGFPVVGKISLRVLPLTIGVGLLSGLMGALFGRLLYLIVRWRLFFIKGNQWMIVSILSGASIFLLTKINAHASGSGALLMNQYLFENLKFSNFDAFVRFFAPVLSYASGAAGGIFSPSLSAGASLGAFCADVFMLDQRNLFILIGMTGFLTGVTRTPFTSFILVLEMTDRHSAIFPMMVAALASHWISQIVDTRSFYERASRRFLRA